MISRETQAGDGAILWEPSAEQIADTNLVAFMDFLGGRLGRRFVDYADLHAFSIADRAAFWDAVWDWCGVVGEKGATVLADDGMPGARFSPRQG